MHSLKIYAKRDALIDSAGARQWGDIFGNETIAAARLIAYCTTITSSTFAEAAFASGSTAVSLRRTP